MKKYLFDIAVYRLSEEAYSKDQINNVKKRIPGYEPEELLMRLVRDPNDKDARITMSNASFHNIEFGGGWRYNEIIGYIRIFRENNQIRAEYWQTNKKRIVKSRKKLFIRIDSKIVPEVNIKDVFSSSEISDAIDLCVDKCRDKFTNKFKNRHLDLVEYNTIFKTVNWVKAFENL
jgi:hypothetical protein